MSFKENVFNRQSRYSHLYGERTDKKSYRKPAEERRVEESDLPRQRLSTDLPLPRNLVEQPHNLRRSTGQPGTIWNNGRIVSTSMHVSVPTQMQTSYMANNPQYQIKYAKTYCVRIVEPEKLNKTKDEISSMTLDERLAYYAKLARACGQKIAPKPVKTRKPRKSKPQKENKWKF